MAKAISIQNVTKRYGDFRAVDRLNLEIEEGELFAFLGPNGAGKTTTIKMLVGLLLADEGELQVCGYHMVQNSEQAKAHVAYVPDQPFLYEKLTGREFLEFVGQMYGLKPAEIQKRMRQLTERLDTSHFLDQLTESYSHGMKQRVVLSAALLHRPDLLVIDEPMVGLDPKTVRTVKDLMREMTTDGRTVFMSTHTLEVAEAVADRIGIIHHGKLIAVGTLEELRQQASQSNTLEDIFLELTSEKGDGAKETIPT